MPIDHGCSGCSCPGYDVLYYLRISVSLSEVEMVRLTARYGGERDYGLSTTTTH